MAFNIYEFSKCQAKRLCLKTWSFHLLVGLKRHDHTKEYLSIYAVFSFYKCLLLDFCISNFCKIRACIVKFVIHFNMHFIQIRLFGLFKLSCNPCQWKWNDGLQVLVSLLSTGWFKEHITDFVHTFTYLSYNTSTVNIWRTRTFCNNHVHWTLHLNIYVKVVALSRLKSQVDLDT